MIPFKGNILRHSAYATIDPRVYHNIAVVRSAVWEYMETHIYVKPSEARHVIWGLYDSISYLNSLSNVRWHITHKLNKL